jgi:hypothetical protein
MVSNEGYQILRKHFRVSYTSTSKIQVRLISIPIAFYSLQTGIAPEKHRAPCCPAYTSNIDPIHKQRDSETDFRLLKSIQFKAHCKAY